MGKQVKSEIVDKYMSEYPDLPNLTLAKKIYKENKIVYDSVDQIRHMIRYRYGQTGKKVRHNAKIQKQRAENANKLGIPNPYTLPESHETIWEPFNLPAGNYGIVSDIHVPYHNVAALEASLEFFKKYGVDALILNGDTMDQYQLSRYEKDPRKRSFKDELEDTRQLLRYLKHHFQGPIYFKIGNHEERWEAFLKIKAPELLDMSEFKLEVLLRFGELGVQIIEDKRIIKAGNLNILHGHEFGRSVFSPVNPARGYYIRSKTNVICGHNHQTSEHTEPNLNGKMTTAWSTGCLCELHPAYMPINKWNHGAARLELYDTGDFNIQNFRIFKGKVV